MKREEIEELARALGVEYAALKAVIDIESAGSGFDPITGKIKIQFEPYHFQKRTGIRVANGVENQQAEWKAFNRAWGYDPEAAMQSTSWGMFQIMGFNHRAAGFQTVGEMVDAFKISEMEQAKGACTFIRNNPPMYRALQKKDWATFAHYYNGKHYKKFNYDARLKKAYENALK